MRHPLPPSIALSALLLAPAVWAQDAMPGMAMPAAPAAAPSPSASMPGMGQPMQGMLGPYPMTRESSGTAWQPDSAAMEGVSWMAGGWSLMAQGYATLVYDDQGGPRGSTKTFGESMGMLMASRDLSSADRLGLRAMVSLDPLMGKPGYPLLFAVGETADGAHPLTDRQHPHDLFMELAATWAHDLGGGTAVSLYAGLPGEPALGPPTFMHRISGMDNPEAPIGHHWFDSTHITFGVVTAGFSTTHWKVEGSVFTGREPDQHRWNIERPRMDSWSVRTFWNPTADLSFQLSTGHLHSPEQLEPEQRTTASVTWNKPLGGDASWASTLAYSWKDERPGPTLDGVLAETALRFGGHHEIFVRAEHEQENELAEAPDPRAGDIYGVGKLTLGYQCELPLVKHVRLAVGGLASAYAYPHALRPDYGARGVKSFMLYTRVKLGD